MVHLWIMKNILTKIKINNYTYIFILLCLLSGYIKNIMLIFFICLFHELGHIFFIKLFAYEIIKVELLPFGGYTTINQKINSNINKDMIIALGGLFFQLILFLLLFLFKSHFHIITYNLLITYNLTIFLFNLLPIVPLDGSKIMELFLEKKLSFHLANNVNLLISFLSLIIFIFLNYYYHLENYFIITFLIYKLIMAYKTRKYLENRFLLERFLYDFPYAKIDNKTKNVWSLKKNVFHYFKENEHYINEKKKISEYFYK